MSEDLKTLAKVGEPRTGQNPDSVCFEPKTKRIFTFNGRSNDSTAIDPKDNEVIRSLPLSGKPGPCILRCGLESAAKLERIAAHVGRNIMYIPLGALSPTKLKRLRVVHVLDSYDRRRDAKDYIW
jgi:hypothetical protein